LDQDTVDAIRTVVEPKAGAIIREYPWRNAVLVGKDGSLSISELAVKSKTLGDNFLAGNLKSKLTSCGEMDEAEGRYYGVGAMLYVGLAGLSRESVQEVRDVVGLETPLLFVEEPTLTLFSKTAYYRPLRGGIKVTTPIATSPGCTLSFAVWSYSVKREITAGHCGNSNDPVYQPASPNQIGSVMADPRGPRYGDTLLIGLLSGIGANGQIYVVYGSSYVWGPVKGASNPSTGQGIRFQGITSCERYTTVTGFRDIYGHPEYGTLYNQVIMAWVTAASGDSGSPLFSFRTWPEVQIHGVLWGGVTGSEVYGSPWSGVLLDFSSITGIVTYP